MNKAVNVADLKDHLSEYLEAVERGAELTICRRNVPFAKLTALPLRPNRTRLGFDRGKIKVRGDLEGPVVPEGEWRSMRSEPERSR
jgi:prevent-host-death family protein